MKRQDGIEIQSLRFAEDLEPRVDPRLRTHWMVMLAEQLVGRVERDSPQSRLIGAMNRNRLPGTRGRIHGITA